MNGWMRKAPALLACIALAFGLSACAKKTGGDQAGPAEPIKIGAVLSMTGTYAGLGESEKKAIELEVKRINDGGGIEGRKLDVIIEDDATDESKAVAVTSKLIGQDGVIAIVGTSGTGQSMAMRSELQRAGVPQVSMAGGTVITSKFDSLVFQTPWSNTIVVPFVLDSIKAAGYTTVALLSDSGGYGKDGREIILKDAKRAGLDVVSDQTFNPGDTDLSTQLTNIRASKADALLIWTAGKEGALALKTASDLGIKMPLYGGSGQARLEFIQGAGPAAEGFIFGTGKSLIPENWEKGSQQYETVADFAKRYEEAYGEKPDIFAGHAFDAMAIVVDALKRAGADTDAAGLRDAIEQTKDLPGFGGTFTFTPTDHNGLTSDDLALYEVKGGTWTSAK